MLYRTAENRFGPDTWDWLIDDNGNLCRGSQAGESSCRSIESVGDNSYRAVGFRTGALRYEFSMEEGSPQELMP